MELLPDVFVGFDGSKLYFIREQIEVAVDASDDISREFRDRYRAGACTAAFGVLGDVREQALEALSRYALLGRTPSTAKPCEQRSIGSAMVLALSDVLAADDLPSGPAILLTATEALFLPLGVERRRRQLALRLFVSGLRPEARLRVYGYAVSVNDRTVIQDAPPPDAVARAVRLLGRFDQPASMDLQTGTTFELGDLPGRLHVVQDLRMAAIGAEPPRICQATATYACPNLRFAEDEPRHAWGTAFEPVSARTKATSEAIERYASGNVRARDLTRAAAKDLDRSYLDPRSIVSYSARQYREHTELHAFSASEENLWGKAQTCKGDEIYVLADLLYYPFARVRRGRWATHAITTSSGVAAHPDGGRAKELALLELVERDAFMRTWLGRHSPPRIRMSGLPGGARALAQRLRASGWNVVLLSIGEAFAPVVLALAARDGVVVLGCAAGEVGTSVTKALAELVPALATRFQPSTMQPEEVRGPHDHQLLFRNPEYASQAAFLTSSETTVAIDEHPAPDLSGLLTRAVFYRLPRCEPENLEIWRVLVPGLIPISFGWDSEPLGLTEVEEIVRESAWDSEPIFPHPFS